MRQFAAFGLGLAYRPVARLKGALRGAGLPLTLLLSHPFNCARELGYIDAPTRVPCASLYLVGRAGRIPASCQTQSRPNPDRFLTTSKWPAPTLAPSTQVDFTIQLFWDTRSLS
jgi:hypothetical protein